MYQLTARMEQTLRQYLKKYHDLFDGGRCSGWELEELVFKSIQSDSTAGHHATWEEGGHDDEADIRVRVNGIVVVSETLSRIHNRIVSFTSRLQEQLEYHFSAAKLFER